LYRKEKGPKTRDAEVARDRGVEERGGERYIVYVVYGIMM